MPNFGMANFNKNRLLSLFSGAELTNTSNARSYSLTKPTVSSEVEPSKLQVKQNLPLPRNCKTSEVKSAGDEGGKTGKKRKRRKGKNKEDDSQDTSPPNKLTKSETEPHNAERKESKTTSKKDEMRERLTSARFRYINEMLYTTNSKEAMKSFKTDPSSFDVYHEGYKKQIEKWPVKPIDLAIKYVKSKPKSSIIADLGCGEAVLADSVPHKVHSFDLKASNKRVTVADMSHLPLQDDTVDIVIFCLSLMGTNISDFIKEAHRILKPGGFMWIAEVASRFDGDLKTFSDKVSSVGFFCASCNTDMTHFVTLTFRKTVTESTSQQKTHKQSKKPKIRIGDDEDIVLAPCLYKKR